MKYETAWETWHQNSEVWPQEIKSTNSEGVGLRLDLGVKSVWQPQTEALFDIRIIDTDTPSYKHRTSEVVLVSVAKDKNRLQWIDEAFRCQWIKPYIEKHNTSSSRLQSV